MRIIGLDIHRAFAEAVAWDDGKLRRLGRVDMRRDLLAAFAEQLSPDDVVVVEATGNASAVAAVLAPHVKKVVIANPMQVRVIAHAKIKTDTIDAGVLAQLYASGFLPEVWVPDEPTQALRRQVTRRNQIVRQRSRLKNIVQSILHSHLIPSCPHADLCGAKGRDRLCLAHSLRGRHPSLRPARRPGVKITNRALRFHTILSAPAHRPWPRRCGFGHNGCQMLQ